MRSGIVKATVFVCSMLVCLKTVMGWTAPEFCRGYACPEYRLVEEYENFEERLYETSRWVRTKVEALDMRSVLSAHCKLSDYINGANALNQKITPTKPEMAIILESDSEEEERYFLSLYVPPDTNIPKPTDESIEEVIIPAGTMFVKKIVGRPMEINYRHHSEKLQNDLIAAGKSFNPRRQMGVYYDKLFMFLSRHDEVWIPAA